MSYQLEAALPIGIETQGDVGTMLRGIAHIILDRLKNPVYLGFLRMVVADSHQFPWIAAEFAAMTGHQTERLVRLLTHFNAVGVLDCRHPTLAARLFIGSLSASLLWPQMMRSTPVSDGDPIEGTVRMFLSHYRPTPTRGGHS